MVSLYPHPKIGMGVPKTGIHFTSVYNPHIAIIEDHIGTLENNVIPKFTRVNINAGCSYS